MQDLNYEMVCRDVQGQFWTREEDLIQELEDLNYEVLGNFGEYIAIDEGNGTEWLLYIGRTGSTIWVSEVKEGN